MNTKECRHCKQPIHVAARICQHCKGSQSWAGNQSDPRTMAVTFGLIFIIVLPLMLWLPKLLMRSTAPPPSPPPTVVVKESEARYEVTECCTRVFVLGEVENTSPTAAGKVWFRVNVFNDAGRLVDTILEQQYGLIVPGNASKTFRVNGMVSVKPDEARKTEVVVERAREVEAYD